MARPAAGPARRGQVFGGAGVVLHCPQTLVSSSTGTTPLALVEPSEGPAWCFTAREPLFLRRRAPRPLPESGLETGWRGASPPANPCFFVDGHHAHCLNRSSRPGGVVLHRPRTLVSSSTGTTPLISFTRTIPGTRPGFPEFPSPQKTKNVGRVLLPQHLADISLSPINQ